MNVMRNQIGWAKLLTMIVFTVGCVLDHVSTFYGLTFPTIVELNPVVLLMIGSGVWNLFEVAVIVAGNGSGFIASCSESRIMTLFSSAALLIVGAIRLVAGFHNVVLVLGIARALELSSVLM